MLNDDLMYYVSPIQVPYPIDVWQLTLSTKEPTPCRKVLYAVKACCLCSLGPFVMSTAAVMQILYLDGDHWSGQARHVAPSLACLQHG